MDEIGEYHAKWDKLISKNKRTNDPTDKRKMTHNEGWEWGKNGGKKDCIEEKEGWEEWGGIKNEANNITRCKFMITQVVCLHSMYKQRKKTFILFVSNFKKELFLCWWYSPSSRALALEAERQGFKALVQREWKNWRKNTSECANLVSSQTFSFSPLLFNGINMIQQLPLSTASNFHWLLSARSCTSPVNCIA